MNIILSNFSLCISGAHGRAHRHAVGLCGGQVVRQSAGTTHPGAAWLAGQPGHVGQIAAPAAEAPGSAVYRPARPRILLEAARGDCLPLRGLPVRDPARNGGVPLAEGVPDGPLNERHAVLRIRFAVPTSHRHVGQHRYSEDPL